MDKRESIIPKILGSSISGVMEIAIFHPVDTISKRLMYNKGKVSNNNLNSIIFKDSHNGNFFSRYKSLYPGTKFALNYKVLQRTYKYGGQSVLSSYISNDNDSKNVKIMKQAAAGGLIGAGEVSLLPLDILKIKSQTNPKQFENRSMLSILRSYSIRSLYKGTGWTIARNVPGSFALFGTNSLIKNGIMDIKEGEKSSLIQTSISSTFSSFASILVSSPMDVIKTRIQASENAENGSRVIKDIISKEGFGAFYKGIIPKLTLVGPKLIFSFTVAQQLIQYIEDI
jgi:hypothetical protein